MVVGAQTLKRDLAAEEQVADGTTATLFYDGQLVEDRAVDCLLGFTDSDTGTNWGDYVCYAGFVHDRAEANHIRVRLGDEMGGGSNKSVFSPVEAAVFYSLWLVVDLEANRYDVYAEGPGLEGQTLVADDYTFRRTGDPDALDVLILKEGGFGDDPFLIDNIYIDTTGQNLTRPPISVLSAAPDIIGFEHFPEASIELTWTAIDGHLYEIERSTDGETWTALVEQITATGNQGSAELFDENIASPDGRLLLRVCDLGLPPA
jgi:hypothetical protein